MHKRLLLVLALVSAFCLNSAAVLAEPLRQGTQVQISSPEINQEIRGLVPIIGSASIPDFQFYKVEFGVGPNPSQWAVLGQLHEQPVLNGQLELWDTTALPDGVYTLQLQAVRKDGNWESFFVRGITIANAKPSPTATPVATDTPEVKETTPTAVPSPVATATLQVIRPTAALAMPTPTPTLSRPMQGQALPINPANWGQAFVFGVITMGAVFVLLGLVFGIRKLL